MNSENPNLLPALSCALLGFIVGVCVGCFLKERATAQHVAGLRSQLAQLQSAYAAEVIRSIPQHSATPQPVLFVPPTP